MLCDHLDIDCLCEHQSIVIEVPLPPTSATGVSTELKNQKSHHPPPLPDRHDKVRRAAAAAIAFQEPLEAIGLEQLKATTRGGRFVAVENNVSAEVLSQMEKQKNKEEVVVEMEFDQTDSLEEDEEEEDEEDNEEDNEEEEEETEQSDHQAAFQPIDSSLLMKDSEMPMLGGERGCKSCQIVAAGQTSLMFTSTADRQLISTEHGQQLNSHSSESNNKNTDDGVEGSGDRPQFTASPSADESKLHLPLESLPGEEEEKEFVSSKQQEEKEKEEEENEKVVAIEDEKLSSPHSCSACAARAAHGQLQLKKEYLSQDPLISIDAARAHFEAAKSEDSEDDDGGGGIIDDEEDILKVAAERLAAIHAEAEDIWRADLEPVVTVVLEGALEDGAKMAGTVNQAVEAVVDEMVDKVADWSLVSLPDLLGKLATAPERLSARWSGQLAEAGRWVKQEFWRWLTEGEEEYSLVEEVEVETEGGEVMVYKRSPLMRWLAEMKVKAFSPPSPLPSPPKMIKEEQQQQLMNSSFYLLPTEDEKEKDKEEEEKEVAEAEDHPPWYSLEAFEGGMVDSFRSGSLLSSEESSTASGISPLSPLKWWLKLMLKKALLPPLSPPVPSPEQQQPSPAEPAAELPLLPSPVKSPSPIKKKKRPLKKRKAKTTAAKVDGKKDLDTPGAEIETPSDLNEESAGQQQQQPLCMDNQPKTTPLRWLAAVLKKALAPPPPPLPLSGTSLQTSSSLSEWPAVTGLSEEANH